MQNKSILLTAFRGSSAEMLIKDVKDYKTIFLPNDKVKDSQKLIEIISKISHNAGTSFCNKLYLNGLKYISQNELNTKMVFVHIPFMKNITEFDSFRHQILEAIAGI